MTDSQATTIGLIFQVSVALAGLLLVFVGFVFARAESFSTRRGDVFRNVARAGILPFALAMISAWLSLCCLEGSVAACPWAVLCLRASMIVTALYAAIVLFMYL
jgi:hypothetical protein